MTEICQPICQEVLITSRGFAGSRAGSPRKPPLLARLASGSWAGLGGTGAGSRAIPQEFGALSSRSDRASETRALRYNDVRVDSSLDNPA